MSVIVGPKNYSRSIRRKLSKIREHSPRPLPLQAAMYRPRIHLNTNKVVSRIPAPDAERLVAERFKDGLRVRIAADILAEIRKGPLAIEDLTTRIALKYRDSEEKLSKHGITRYGIESLYKELVKAGIIAERG